jgi:5-methylcytosine-specific restriction endonuclease McrA
VPARIGEMTQRSEESKAWRHLYKRAAWKRLRLEHLASQPWCQYCAAIGRRRQAQVVDHKVPHKGDEALFFARDNLQSLCKLCHDSAKQRLERTGVLPGCNAAGLPIDPGHHWNR